MKTRQFILPLLFSVGLLISCTDSKISEMLTASSLSNELSLSVSSVEADYKSYSRSLWVVADKNTSWQFSNIPSWVTVNPISGKGNSEVRVNFEANDGPARSETIQLNNKVAGTSGFLPLMVSQSRHPAVAVDLGLSVKWADANIGALSPEEYGSYYCWGDVHVKSEYSWTSYFGYTSTSLLKYNTSSLYGDVDNKTVLELTDDIAHMSWDGNWRIPTKTEIEELVSSCTWTWVTQNGVQGYKVTSKKTGFSNNSIFLPAAGYRIDNRLDSVGVYTFYWSNTLWDISPIMSYGLSLSSHNASLGATIRCYGYPVRAVCPSDNWEGVTSITLYNTALTLKRGQSDTIKVSVMSGNTTFPSSAVVWSSSNTSVAEVDDRGIVKAKAIGTAIITATCDKLSASASVTVIEADPVIEAVDLGLSVLWATCNVGAITPEETGFRYAWGEKETKTYYTWENYKYRTDGSTINDVKFSKYNKDSSRGNVDNKETLELEDDVAHSIWGGNWRMPVKTEFNELVNNCKWQWITQNGIDGYLVTSNIEGYTDKSIFIPGCDYWSSSLSSNGYSAWVLTLSSNVHSTSYFSTRESGLRVRPVCTTSATNVVSSIELSTTYIVMKVGETLELTAIAKNSAGTTIDADILWSTTDSNVATVSSDGKVQVVGIGSCQIKATNGSVSTACTIDVFDDSKVVASVYINFIIVNLIIGDTQELIAVARNSDDEVLDNASFLWSTSNSSVATVSSNGLVKAVGQGSCIITASCDSKTAPCTINVSDVVHSYVDLGLSVKWATCNIGATKREDYGDYYAWGEVETKTSYSWAAYKYGTSDSNISKYNSDGSKGTVDYKTALDQADDVAHVKWGGSWRMPTYAEQRELINNCYMSWTTVNGVNGYLFTSKKPGYESASIFLPAGGNSSYGMINNIGSKGFYWSKTLSESEFAWLLDFSSYFEPDSFDEYRYVGCLIRPVCP